MDINTIINAVLLLVTAGTAICALRQYLEQKDSQEQAREICIYLIALYDTTDNLWKPLTISPQGKIDGSVSMHYGLMIENNSKQPIRDLTVEINTEAFINYKLANMKISEIISNVKLLPPEKWVISIDETPTEKGESVKISQGINLLSDLVQFENASYVPVVRTKVEGIKRYSFKDHMGHQWVFSSERNNSFKKCRVGRKLK